MHPKQDVPPESLAVVVEWIGHPGTSPRDPRARRCFSRWNDPRPPQNLINQAIEKKNSLWYDGIFVVQGFMTWISASRVQTVEGGQARRRRETRKAKMREAMET